LNFSFHRIASAKECIGSSLAGARDRSYLWKTPARRNTENGKVPRGMFLDRPVARVKFIAAPRCITSDQAGNAPSRHDGASGSFVPDASALNTGAFLIMRLLVCRSVIVGMPVAPESCSSRG